MKIEDKIKLLAEVLDLEPCELLPEMVLLEMEEWDSMAKLGIIVMFEDEYGIKVTRKEVMGFKTVQDILDKME